ncbi:bifunctional tRNA (5-methylaminomethyl-2-thiouridine)(34)-methyltransferase MnmD/FAD-dependent 5-carboxymethylaminomethyl-2-thiouridine(34) oxidoreductase MnmC [Halomonas salipaludis]|uniref:tRNA 5-methylaminomethyl-2-thiouridine biosynthesis bifunctional protein MnmC n=1 Tax=Halomonas salipaludis TaxID=2032625 RepID=A0A2A2EUR5_9GAMM|nr:bifunctional tRNA (5-methylaminomethyl-2-thiouridine)(34)-methyltransferase MnmD/FAD-dependent 5-carboxymethylaminomethyl-2-thiouridine(34) oxidoreductase MnmC [Halomonas salipaludis]PAU76033.1 bifunctional tRNA (5-methylaminomethyl-2-thiouridine)(34)-methyltransferase MnmD/FAD-dependent 5-carboxymethylaminomethyl-2-thiouridine(34) oxidoreductase MnmC [Halomonas salipaludis]
MTDRPRDSLAALETARLDWQRDDGDLETPHSLAFGDVYFSRQDGRAETEHVFVEGNDLPRRFREWCEPRPFVIGETGFGTGLNVLCAWACFTRYASPDARLHLVSTEKYPLARADLARALAAWPELAEAAARLVDQWPEPVAGVHRLWLDSRVTLDLHFGDSAECLAALDGRVDAWFLDGFAPSKNPQMWQPALFEAMSRRSRDGATFATFTCAGVVKRGLKAAGFAWRKVPGFGRKREMLAGELATPSADETRRATPWFTPPPPRPARHVAVIGAGLAGASVAHALARRGVRITLLDREAPGAGASGNAQGALYIKLAVAPNAHSRVYLAGLLHSRRWLEALDPEGALWQPSGVLQLANDSREAERQARFLVQYGLPETVVEGVGGDSLAKRSGLPPQAFSAARALDYPGAGWVRPQALCQRLATSPGVTFQRGEVARLAPTAHGWCLTLADGANLDADQVVIATAQLANRFDQTAELPLQAIRGQVSQVSLPEGVPAPTRVICAGGYVPPPQEGVLTFGATFAPHDQGDKLREADHAANLAELERTLPGYLEALRKAGVDLDPARMDGRAAVRAASPDKLPYAGPVPDSEAWRRDYTALAKDAKRIPATPGAHHGGLWISAAHGSRGLASAPLCAELIASRICDEPLPLPAALVDQLHPGRRLIRDLIRLTPR